MMMTRNKSDNDDWARLLGRADCVIGIDPDVERSGVALCRRATRQLEEVTTLAFPALMDYLREAAERSREEGTRLVVAVEAGWLNRAHWHLRGSDSARAAAAKGNATGRNHETGRLICEMARHYGLEVDEVRPLRLHVGGRPLWQGRDGKITHEELVRITHLSARRTNQEERDAALIAWTRAGLPI